MRIIVTRPEADARRTAEAVRARGHEALLTPLLRIEPADVDLSGAWSGVLLTSANAATAVAASPARGALTTLPLFAVGQRSAEAARNAGFTNVLSAEGDVYDLARLVTARRANASAPLLYLAGEDRSSDLVGKLGAQGMAVEMKVVYRAIMLAFPQALIETLRAGAAHAVLHFSKRSAESYVAGARATDLVRAALGLQHYCLSFQITAPLIAAGATSVVIAPLPAETALISALPQQA